MKLGATWVLLVCAMAGAVLGQIDVRGPHELMELSLRDFFRSRMDIVRRDGAVDKDDLAMYAWNMDPSGPTPRLFPERMGAAIARFDTNGDGVVTEDEFVSEFMSEPMLNRDHAGMTPEEADAAENETNVPVEVHLHLTSEDYEMRVMWIATLNYTDAPLVQYGLSPSDLNRTASGTSTTYNVGWLSGFYWFIFTAVMTDVAPGNVYYYRVGQEGQWSDVMNFTSAPAEQPPTSRWAVYGDMGTIPFGGTQVISKVLEAHEEDPLCSVLHVGDVAYAGVTSSGEYTPTWDVFGGLIAPLASQIPYMTSVGNHESYYNYTGFLHRYVMPGNETGGQQNFWFSYDLNGVHVTSMSTEHDYSPGSPQYEWLVQDMISDKARKARWRVLAGHRPFLCSDNDELSSHVPGAPQIATMEPLLLNFSYDLVFTGHQHMCEVVFPNVGGKPVVANGTTVWSDPGAPVYVVQGNSGAIIAETVLDPQPVWSAFRDWTTYGYGLMSVYSDAATEQTPCPSGTRDAVGYQMISLKQEVMYTFWVCKSS